MRIIFFLIIASIITVFLLFKVDQEFQPDNLVELQKKARDSTTKDVPNDFTTDGCTMFPNKINGIDLTDICIEHDMAYWAGGTEEQRIMADIKLRDAINRKIIFLGSFMYGTVRIMGNSKIPSSWRWGYGYL